MAKKAAKKATKKATTKTAPAKKRGDKMSALDAAAKVLGEAKEPLNTKTMIDRALWLGESATVREAVGRHVDNAHNPRTVHGDSGERRSRRDKALDQSCERFFISFRELTTPR